MFDWDAVIIGGGPAGLTAGLYLARANRRTILLERESFGGFPKNVEWIENYPGFPEGVSGPKLVSAMVSQATRYGLNILQAEVASVELFSGSRWVGLADGSGFTTAVIIIAGGSKPKKLGVPGEEELDGKGIIHCALCDGDDFAKGTVVVCGGGDAGITEALYLARLGSRVIVLEALPRLTATPILQDRALANGRLSIRCGTRVQRILGKDKVEAVECVETSTGKKETLRADGVLVHVGLEPNTDYLEGVIPLDEQRQVLVDARMQSRVPFVLAAGDIRSGSPRQIAAAVGDGAIAGISAQRLLQEMEV